MAEGATSVDALLADAISKMDTLSKRMDAWEEKEKKEDSAKKADAKKADDDDDKRGDDDDDDKRKDSKKADGTVAVKTRILDSKKADEEEDEEGKKKEDSAKRGDDDDDDDKRKDSKRGDDDDDKRKDSKRSDKKRGDDGELELKHKGEGELKEDKRKDSKKADDDDDKRGDDDDDKRSDSVVVSRKVLERLAHLERIIKPMTDEEHAQFSDAQARADAIYNGFGKRAPRPLEGEAIVDYRTRLANDLKMHSKTWSKAKLTRLPLETFEIAEAAIYADAAEAARHPVDLGENELRAVTSVDQNTGLRTTKFYGRESFVKGLGRPGRRLVKIRTDRLSA